MESTENTAPHSSPRFLFLFIIDALALLTPLLSNLLSCQLRAVRWDQLAEPTGKLFGGVVGGSVDSVLSVAIDSAATFGRCDRGNCC